MSITGIEKLEFGVENIAQCAKFMVDFGLQALPGNSNNTPSFRTLSGAQISLYPLQTTQLPPAFESGSTLRRVTWGVDSPSALAALRPLLVRQPAFKEIDGGYECLDPNGMALQVKLSQQNEVELPVSGINQWGDIRRIDQPSPVYQQATPINIGHVVFFVEDLASTEDFYREVLGFSVSDRYIDRAVFLRAQTRGGHHNLFLLQLPKPCSLYRPRHSRGDRRWAGDE